MLPSKSIEFVKKIREEVNVPNIPAACASCQEELSYPLYWCRWNGDFRCKKCVEEKTSPAEGYYKFKNNSILLTEDRKILPSSNLGENVQP